MIDWFLTNLESNQIMQAAVVAAPVTALTYAARNLPTQLWSSVKHFISYDLVFRSDTENYYEIAQYILENVVSKKWSRDFSYDIIQRYDPYGNSNNHRLGASIGYGNHWGMYKGYFVIVNRALEEGDISAEFRETLTVTFVSRNYRITETFSNEISEILAHKDEDDLVKIRSNTPGGWREQSPISKRSPETLFLGNNAYEKALDHIKKFDAERAEYARRGMPYHTGILLTGPPGTAKTSLVHVLASQTGRNLRFLSLSSIKSDAELMEVMSSRSDWNKSILVMEDFDVARAATDRDKESQTISLSTLLNILDGFMTPEGLVTIATTNHPENLDPALVREGRFDLKIELGPLAWDEARKMADLLLGENNQFGTIEGRYTPTVGSKLRTLLISDGWKSHY